MAMAASTWWTGITSATRSIVCVKPGDAVSHQASIAPAQPTFTSPPLFVKGKVIAGVAGGGLGVVRGYLTHSMPRRARRLAFRCDSVARSSRAVIPGPETRGSREAERRGSPARTIPSSI